MKNGLYGKYKIEKADGTELDPNARYFVLRYDKDRHAKAALLTYAGSVEHETPGLARDLRNSLADVGDLTT